MPCAGCQVGEHRAQKAHRGGSVAMQNKEHGEHGRMGPKSTVRAAEAIHKRYIGKSRNISHF